MRFTFPSVRTTPVSADGSSRLAAAGGIAGALAAMAGTALWVEHRSRTAERMHTAPHRIMYIEGTRLHYRDVGEGPPVVLLHGNLLHGADFEASGLVDRLARDRRVIVIDRPGFGHSDRPRGIAWTPARQARLLRRALSILDVHRPVIVGHSLGTQVALSMALQQPLDTAGLVLVAGYYWPGFRADRWMVAPATVPLLGDLMRYTVSALAARATLGMGIRGIFDPLPVPADFHHYLPREMLLRPLQQRATAEDGMQMVPQARALQEQYERIRMPVTLIAGEKDRVVSPGQSERLRDALPDARLHLLPGVGHMAHHAAPDLVADMAREAARG